MQMLELLASGIPAKEVAATLGVSLRSIRRWTWLLRNAGPSALKHKPAPGRPRKLDSAAECRLRIALANGARAAGFGTDSWTGPRIARFIETQFGVQFHVDHIGRLLRSLGWSLGELNRHVLQRQESRRLELEMQDTLRRIPTPPMPLYLMPKSPSPAKTSPNPN